MTFSYLEKEMGACGKQTNHPPVSNTLPVPTTVPGCILLGGVSHVAKKRASVQLWSTFPIYTKCSCTWQTEQVECQVQSDVQTQRNGTPYCEFSRSPPVRSWIARPRSPVLGSSELHRGPPLYYYY